MGRLVLEPLSIRRLRARTGQFAMFCRCHDLHDLHEKFWRSVDFQRISYGDKTRRRLNMPIVGAPKKRESDR